MRLSSFGRLMKNKIIRIGLFFAIFLSLLNCAKRGTPGGGLRDITPPKLIKASPDLNTINFKGQKIRIAFDEYIKLNDLQEQLIISPPLNQFPDIRPQGSANKFLEVFIKDTLKENTTYVFNFGQSIVDNNEGNPYQFFKYVFSTGDYIDSLEVSGYITDAKEKNAEDFVSVMLYKIDSTYTDSIIYKNPPTYITNTLDSTINFQLTNLKAGKYMMIAMKDVGNNNLFNQKTDKIAFLDDFIEIPTDSSYQLNLFKEINDYRASKPSLVSKNRIIFGYEGTPDEMEIEILSEVPEDFRYKITKEREKDTLNYWFTPFEADSLLFKVSHPTKIDTFTIKIKDLYRDSLSLSPVNQRNIRFEKPYIIAANIPLTKTIDSTQIALIDKDSIAINFTTNIDTVRNEFKLKWDVKPNERYSLQVLPGAVEDFYGNTNDTMNYFLSSKSYADLGSINVMLRNVPSYPIIVQLTNERGEVKAEKFADGPQASYDFRYLDPDKYLIRVIIDTNGNRKWDTGNYLQKLNPEHISYFPTLVELRENWELQQTFTLD